MVTSDYLSSAFWKACEILDNTSEVNLMRWDRISNVWTGHCHGSWKNEIARYTVKSGRQSKTKVAFVCKAVIIIFFFLCSTVWLIN